MENQVRWLEYVEKEYGNSLQQAMLSCIHLFPGSAQQTAVSAVLNQSWMLSQDESEAFIQKFKAAGGNEEYLRYALTCFRTVVHKIVKVG